MREPLRVQYGCGLCAPAGWRNFDASPTLRFERLPVLGKLYQKNKSRFPENAEFGDIVRGLPLPTSSADVVFASHVLEHLALEDFRAALRNTFAILKPGGAFRLIVPDLEVLARRYVEEPGSGAASAFIRATAMGRERRERGLMGLMRTLLGHSIHLWMWDYRGLEDELTRVGFVDIRRCYPGDSKERCFGDVEDPGRFDDAVGVECRRPSA